MQFRKEALARVNPQQALDLPVRLTSTRSWIVLVILAAVVVGGGTWAFTGTLPRTLSANGLITSPKGSFPIQTVAASQVTDIYVQQGSEVRAGDVVARLSNGVSRSVVRAPAHGRVFSVAAHVGGVVAAGTTLAVAEYADGGAAGLVAVLYLPGDSTAALHPGAAVDLSAAAAPVTRYGVMRGRITSIDSFLSTRSAIADFVGDEDFARSRGPTPEIRYHRQRIRLVDPNGAAIQNRFEDRRACRDRPAT
jgi:multidrug efflux pump subunit AcrA (membrane-fusion protein)